MTKLNYWLCSSFAAATASVMISPAFAQSRDSFLQPAGPIAETQRTELFEIFGWTMIAILPVFVLVPIFLWRYRYRNTSARYTPDWDKSRILEIVMWGVPVLIVGILSVQLFKTTHDLDPYRSIASDKPELRVQVIGLDWKWLFIYPDYEIATVNALALPVDTPVAFDLTTDTVMQSFLISSLAGQIYTMPGMRTQLHVLADEIGTFQGENTQFNGIGFTEQKFETHVLSESDFNAWVAQVRSSDLHLDPSTYAVLAPPSTGAQARDALNTNVGPEDVTYFSSVADNMFQSVVHRYMHGKPVTATAQPGTAQFQPNSMAGQDQ